MFVLMQTGFAQSSTTTASCYDEWYSTFQKYGANTVADGTHEVIIAISKNASCQCVYGKVDVKGGKLVEGTLYLMDEDGSYHRPDRTLSLKYSRSESKVENWIANGMSPTYLTSQDESVNIFFYKSLNKKPKTAKQAPSPSGLGFE